MKRCRKSTQALFSSKEECKRLTLELLVVKASQGNYEAQGNYERLESRFAAYMKNREDVDTMLDKTNRIMMHLDYTTKEQKIKIQELESQLAFANGDLVRWHPQVATARVVRDRTFRYGYGVGMAHLRAHLLANP